MWNFFQGGSRDTANFVISHDRLYECPSYIMLEQFWIHITTNNFLSIVKKRLRLFMKNMRKTECTVYENIYRWE